MSSLWHDLSCQVRLCGSPQLLHHDLRSHTGFTIQCQHGHTQLTLLNRLIEELRIPVNSPRRKWAEYGPQKPGLGNLIRVARQLVLTHGRRTTVAAAEKAPTQHLPLPISDKVLGCVWYGEEGELLSSRTCPSHSWASEKTRNRSREEGYAGTPRRAQNEEYEAQKAEAMPAPLSCEKTYARLMLRKERRRWRSEAEALAE